MNKKIALVTGASGAIGQAITSRLIEDGYFVVLQYCRNKKAAESFVSRYKEKADCLFGDFSSRETIAEFIENVFIKYPKIDALVNNAGISETGLFIDFSDGQIERMLNINLLAPMLIIKSAAKGMADRRGGSIVNVSSIWGLSGGACEAHYSAAKGGLITFTQSMAKELGAFNVRINCVAPALIDTEMNAALSDDDKRAFLETTPFSRIGTPEDVANAVSFLLSDKASYISGQTVRIG